MGVKKLLFQMRSMENDGGRGGPSSPVPQPLVPMFFIPILLAHDRIFACTVDTMSLTPHLHEGDRIAIVDFIRTQCENAAIDTAVLGLSGGLDSAVVAVLCAEALGAANVHTFYLPDHTDERVDEDEHEDADAVLTRHFAHKRGLGYDNDTIAPIVEQFRTMVELDDDAVASEPGRTALGNIKARTRMIVLYYYANIHAGMVMGTGNKSELLVGYFTKYGDGGADLLPLGDLYKTQVRALARQLDIPDEIVDRPPSAGLWEGQTDEEELGISYERLDRILLGTELGLEVESIAEKAEIPAERVRTIQARVRANAHKRRLGGIPKLAPRTIGIDYREW